MNKPYPVAFEVSGPLGMFADHASGSESISHPIPPPTACQGIIESVIRILGVEIEIAAVGLCHEPKWTKYTTNSMVATQKNINDDSGIQIRESLLFNPCFQILAVLSTRPDSHTEIDPSTGNPKSQRANAYKHLNHAHSMQQQFYRRLCKANCFQFPSLGRREFFSDYIGHQRTPIHQSYYRIIPSMITQILRDAVVHRKVGKCEIRGGIAKFAYYGVHVRDDGMLVFDDSFLQRQIDFFRAGGKS